MHKPVTYLYTLWDGESIRHQPRVWMPTQGVLLPDKHSPVIICAGPDAVLNVMLEMIMNHYIGLGYESPSDGRCMIMWDIQPQNGMFRKYKVDSVIHFDEPPNLELFSYLLEEVPLIKVDPNR